MSLTAAVSVLQVRDPSLTVAERYVLLVYAVHAAPTNGDGPLEAWPTAATVSAETGLTREHVQRCLRVLQDRGLLRQTGRRRGRSNVYEISVRRIDWLGHHITPTCDVTSHQRVMSDHTERKGERKGKEHPLTSPTPTAAADPHFVEFWKVYPRHVAKGAAVRAWAKAVKRADPALILDGARRFATDPNLPDPQFVPHPATWLNQDRWEDDPLPPRRGKTAAGITGTNDAHWAAGGEF